MASMFALSPRLSSAAAITASSALATMPVTNLQGVQPSKVWRSSTLTGVTIDLDFGGATAIDTLALVRPNFTAAATWRLYGATSQGNLGVSGYDSTPLSPWPGTGKPTDPAIQQHTCLLRIGSTQTYRWWRLALTDAANPAGYFEAGALLLGAAVSPTRNLDYGWEFGDEPADVVAMGPYGRTVVDERDAPRTLSIPLKALYQADAMGGLGALLAERKTSKPFLLCVNPDETTYLHVVTQYGLRVGPRTLSRVSHPLYATTFKHRELL